MIKTTALTLEELLEKYFPLFKNLRDEEASVKPLPSKWSKKEILGHLIDSAQNNLRRFIVAQYEEQPKIVYRQDFWVASIHYQEWKMDELIQLWYLTNRQIVRVLHSMTEEASARTCETESPRTIGWLTEDYLKHLRHHVHQVLGLEEVVYP
jgi:hypothetical protein